MRHWMKQMALLIASLATFGCVDGAPEVPAGNNTSASNATTPNATTPNASTPNATTPNASTPNATTPNNSGGPWIRPDANRRVALEFTPAGFEGTLTPFNASLRFDTETLEGATSTSVRFVSEDDELLAHEVAIWNDQRAMVWVRLPEVTARVSQTIWVYWHTEDELPQDPNEMWAERYLSVYHFDATAPGYNSATGTVDLTCTGCVPAGGVSSRGLDTSEGGLAGQLPEGMLVEPDGKLTISAWYRPDAGALPEGPLVYSESYCAGWQTALVRTMDSNFTYASYATDEAISPGDPASYCGDGTLRTETTIDLEETPTAHHIVMVIDRESDRLELHRNGSLSSTLALENGEAVSDQSGYTPRFRIGTREDPDGGDTLVGASIDEVFVLPEAVSARWIAAHHSNLKAWGQATIVSDVQAQP